MTSEAKAAQPVAGKGRLAEVIASRGGLAAPEAPFVIEHREALIDMLRQAAELEHGIMCQYLFAAFSLKQRADEGLTPEELEAVTRRDSMRFAFDLWSLNDVSAHADAILDRLEAGTMPCDGAWPAERVAVFRRWIDAGKP